MQAIITPLPVPDTPVAPSAFSYCQFQNAPRLAATALRGHDLLWYTSASGGIGSSIAGTFAVYASAIDYRGNVLETKNTVTLIR